MAKYNDDYTRINWQNYPITATPINETNLNNMDGYLKTISERIAELSTYTPCIRYVDELPEQGVEGLVYVYNNKLYSWSDDTSNYTDSYPSYIAGWYSKIYNGNTIDTIPEIIDYTVTSSGTVTCNKTFSDISGIFQGIGVDSSYMDNIYFPYYHLRVLAPSSGDYADWDIRSNTSVMATYNLSLGAFEIVTKITPDYIYKITHKSNNTITLDKIAFSGGGGGTTYTAGNGIDITNGVISVDLDSAENNSF